MEMKYDGERMLAICGQAKIILVKKISDSEILDKEVLPGRKKRKGKRFQCYSDLNT
jgi:hypothetical protein